MSENLEKTLKEVAEIGYRYVEMPVRNVGEGGRFEPDYPAEKLKKYLDQYSLSVIGCHIGYEEHLDLDGLIKYNNLIDSKRVIIPAHFFSSKQDVYDFAHWLNATGRKLSQYNIELYYHNHYHEFQKVEGELILDLLVALTDPAYVHFELDTFWTIRAGVDPEKYLEKLGSRCKLVHQKDLNRNTKQVNLLDIASGPLTRENTFSIVDEEDFVEIGNGVIDIKGIIKKIAELPSINYLIVEQDKTKKDELVSVRESYENLLKLIKESQKEVNHN